MSSRKRHGAAPRPSQARDIKGAPHDEKDALRKADSLAHAQRLAHVGSWDWDLERDEAEWSDEMFRIFGLDPTESGGDLAKALTLMHPDDRKKVADAVRKALEGTQPYDVEYRIIRPNGDIRHARARGEVFRDAGGRPIRMIGAVHDLTELKLVENALRESELAYRRIVETTHEGIWVIDDENRTTFVNPRMAEMLGYSQEEMVGHHLFEFLDEGVREQASPENSPFRGRLGTQVELPYRHKDGTPIWTLMVSSPIIDDRGSYVGTLAMFSDITEQHAARRTREEILDVISHEFRTPVTVILGYTQLAASGRWNPSSNDWAAIRTKIELAGRHLSFLLNSLTELSLLRAGAPRANLELLSSSAILREAAEVAEIRRPDPARDLQIRVAEGAAEVSGDRRKLLIALAEIIDNAAKFSPKGSLIRVSASLRDGETAFEVVDRGPGIPEAIIQKLGTPFVQMDLSSTRKAGGAGLGLALAHGVVKAQGGRIEVEHPPGGGSAVRIMLPR